MSFMIRSKPEVKDRSDFDLECRNENATAHADVKSYKSRHTQEVNRVLTVVLQAAISLLPSKVLLLILIGWNMY